MMNAPQETVRLQLEICNARKIKVNFMSKMNNYFAWNMSWVIKYNDIHYTNAFFLQGPHAHNVLAVLLEKGDRYKHLINTCTKIHHITNISCTHTHTHTHTMCLQWPTSTNTVYRREETRASGDTTRHCH